MVPDKTRYQFQEKSDGSLFVSWIMVSDEEMMCYF